MTSDNDGESVSSSGSGRPSPVPATKAQHPTAATAAVGCKGILVHNNKKSANTNRVSFVANSPSSSSSSSQPPQPQPQPQLRPPSSSLQSTTAPGYGPLKYKNSDRHQDCGGGPAGDLQLPYCGRTFSGFGVKSYLHEFYDDPERGDAYQQDDYEDDDDDFRYCVEPEIRWRRHCGGMYMVLGLATMTVGAATMAAGHLIPAMNPLVTRSANIEVIDRWAVSFNEHLASCRYVGSVLFAVGAVFSVIRFWVSVMSGSGVEAEKKLAAADGRYGDDWQKRQKRRRRRQQADKNDDGCKQSAAASAVQTVRIPITGSVENVQPDPRAISLKLADSS